ncbi:MAG: enoyl-CoA hydratase-related protein [Pseudomonadota bacterium]
MPEHAGNTLRIEDKGDYLAVVSDNPANKNALTLEYHALLLEAMRQATTEDRITSVVLVGRSGYFSAGGDLALLAGALETGEKAAWEPVIRELQDCVAAIRACPKPVIAAVAGGAAGAGFAIALACDLVIVEEGAAFMPAYVKIGVAPDGGLTSTLASQLPHPLAAEICLFGSPVTAERLHQFGLINRITPVGAAESEAQALAAKLARGPAVAQSKIKELLVKGRQNSFNEQLDLERSTLVDILGSRSAREGINAFLEKRRPDFPAAEGRAR